ncbi:glycine-rich domain-containing protein [Bdellovibrio sp. HCB337]|uniref:glycine-rich domain-containing protein n=1 Tax=Bdellovibrio sp. HCB337 TaxID=3394358 RepID=UPI0039A472D4
MRSFFFLILVLFAQNTFSSTHASPCDSGGSCGTRGGGDFLEWSFYDVAKAIVPRLELSIKLEVKDTVPKLKLTLQCLKVEISQAAQLELDGRSVMAINIPAECKIILSRPSWESLKTNNSRVRLVLHELLALSLVSDFQYELSQRMTEEYFHVSAKPVVSKVNSWKLFTDSQYFEVPADVATIKVIVVGAGGGGGGGHLNRGSGGGGGAGGAVKAQTLFVESSSKIAITVGKGGAGGLGGGLNGLPGGSSSFGDALIAEGGGGGYSGYYNSTMAYGGSGGGSGGGGGGNGVYRVCSGAGGSGGSAGENGWVSKKGGAGGAGTAWAALTDFIHLVEYSKGDGGICAGPENTYNGGGGGGGLVLDSHSAHATSGTASVDQYSGYGGTGGQGFGAGGGGGTGAEGTGGEGFAGAVYIEYFSEIN